MISPGHFIRTHVHFPFPISQSHSGMHDTSQELKMERDGKKPWRRVVWSFSNLQLLRVSEPQSCSWLTGPSSWSSFQRSAGTALLYIIFVFVPSVKQISALTHWSCWRLLTTCPYLKRILFDSRLIQPPVYRLLFFYLKKAIGILDNVY